MRRGVRSNLGFEALALSPSGRYLFAAVENALAGDGPVSDVGVASWARLLAFDLERGGSPRELAYRVEPVSMAPVPAGGFRLNGLVELLRSRTTACSPSSASSCSAAVTGSASIA